MIRRILSILIALTAIVVSANAQSLSVQPIEVQVGGQTEVVVSLTGGTSATALQFNLKLPEGISANANNATLGSATDGHTLNVELLDNGDLLFILYSMDLKTFKEGILLRIPINGVLDDDARLYTIRFSSADAVSHSIEDVVTGISLTPKSSPMRREIYNVAGQLLGKMQKGINIKEGKKILVK